MWQTFITTSGNSNIFDNLRWCVVYIRWKEVLLDLTSIDYIARIYWWFHKLIWILRLYRLLLQSWALQIWLDYLLYHECFIVNKDCFDGQVYETILVSCIIARLFHKLAISSSKCSRRLYSYTYWDIKYLFVRMESYKPIYFTSTSNMIYLLRKWRYFCGI